ncbi:MAG TPA: hypothetical protein VE288_06555 [Rubrobacteraceae bacterium]|nr:hypothetical protein [Rubrobacteraceae bacterium]
MIEAVRVRFPHYPPNPQAAEPHRRSCRRKHHHPLCEKPQPVARYAASDKAGSTPGTQRALADLPWQAVPVTVHLCARRFFCEEETCHRAVFAERLPRARSATTADEHKRLHEWFTHVSFAHVERHSSDGCVGVCRQSNSSYK